jgi:hypothetical protein
MLVGQTAIQVSNAIFQRGGAFSLFGEEPFIPSPFLHLLADHAAEILHTSRLSPGCRIDAFAPLPAAKRANSFGSPNKGGRYHNGLAPRS